MNEQVSTFRQRLLYWGSENTSSYPWRWINNPYYILVSEFMLHRTQVKQVIAVYEHFIELCPTLETFANTDAVQIRNIMSPLGLQWRIDGMLNALSILWEQHKTVPTDRQKLMSIDGIGQYIAGATACFANNEPVTLIDTNTVRVVGRVFGHDLSGEARRRKSLIQAISDACDPQRPREYYYSIIDFAHQVCTPRTPDCQNCPLLDLPCHFGNEFVTQLEE